MARTRATNEDGAPPELLWVGNGAWMACDPAAAEDDPGRVIAYVECKDSIVYVLWVHGRERVDEYSSIGEALVAVGQRMTRLAAPTVPVIPDLVAP